jgi:hypothetical protein
LPISEKLFHHEEHEEYEVLKKGIKTSERFFFVLFVVKIGLRLAALRFCASPKWSSFGCGSASLSLRASNWEADFLAQRRRERGDI